MSEAFQENFDSLDIKDTSEQIAVETITNEVENDIDTKDPNCTEEVSDVGISKTSRELKLLLALSKESKMELNIGHKRKSTECLSKPIKPTLENNAADLQSQMKSSIFRVDYNKSDTDNLEMPETKDDTNELDSTSGIADECENVTGESTNVVFVINNQRKDPFCWNCHHCKATFYCETCPRSFHQKCLKHCVTPSDHWICPVCIAILKAENINYRSPAIREKSLEHFCGLLKFALKRIMQVEGHGPFTSPVNEVDFPEYKKYVAQPQDLTSLEKNVKNNVYASARAFEADAQWILHNSIIFNSYHSKFTTIAKSMMKICKQEMSEIENCANCYLNANTKIKTWFVEVCPKPHLVVWAKLKGFPYWPAKAMRTNSLGMVDVRFFGAHDRAWVPCKDCFLYCLQDPNANKQKRNDINESIKELNIYIENLKRRYGEFNYAPYKVVVDPDQELKQLKIQLPKYDPEKKINIARGFRRSLHRNGNCSPVSGSSERDVELSAKLEEDLLQQSIQSDSSNCDSAMDDTSSVSNLSVHSSCVIVKGGFVDSPDKTSKGSPNRKRVSCDDVEDCPPKLSRHDSNDTLALLSDGELPEISFTGNELKASELLPEIECPKLVDETKAIDEQSVYKKLSDLIDEPTEKDKIVSETDILLDTVNKKIDSILEKVMDFTENIDSNKSKSAVGSVEVIEVDVGDCSEQMDSSKLEVSIDIEDTVQASDVSTASIPIVEKNLCPAVNFVNEQEFLATPTQKIPETEVNSEIINTTVTSNIDSLDQNLNLPMNTGQCTIPLNFVEVAENRPLDEEDCTEALEDELDLQPLSNVLDEETEITDNGANAKRRLSTDATEDTSLRKKSLKLVNIDNFKYKPLNADASPIENNQDSSVEPLKSLQTLLEKHLIAPNKNSENLDTVVIKSEPNSEDELNDAEYMEMKLLYLQALNISEKKDDQPIKKPISMRTRSKSEEYKIKSNNVAKTIDGVVQGNGNIGTSVLKSIPPKKKEIFIKPLATTQLQKQKARKSFPIPIRNVYPSAIQKRDIIRLNKPPTNLSTLRTSPLIKSSEVYTSTNNVMYVTHSPTMSNSVTLLTPNPPISYATSRGNPILTLVPHPNNYQPLASVTSKGTTNDKFESQNYIPMSGEVAKPKTTLASRIVITSVPENSVTNTITQMTSTAVTSAIVTTNVLSSTINTASDVSDILGSSSSLIQETLNRTLRDVICRPPPKLKQRPPGPLRTHFDEGIPSSAGTVTSRINSISHRLGDYFRGMLIELLHEMSDDNPEVEVIKLKLENEELKHKHNLEIIEIKKNVSNIFNDIQESLEERCARIVEETRSVCETECIKRVDEAKSKQWCANCPKEAQLYCCWNTSYCDFPCQKNHWPKHMPVCSQNGDNSNLSQSTSNGNGSTNTVVVPTSLTASNVLGNGKPTQPLIWRQTSAPKAFSPKALIAKPTKLFLNRTSSAKNAISYVRTNSASKITLVESTPGNYELVGNGGPISVGGKFITGLGKIRHNVISVPPPSSAPSTSTNIATNTPKILLSQTKPVPVTTVISDEED